MLPRGPAKVWTGDPFQDFSQSRCIVTIVSLRDTERESKRDRSERERRVRENEERQGEERREKRVEERREKEYVRMREILFELASRHGF